MAVFSPLFRDAPAACRRMERDALLQAVLGHARSIVKQHKGKMDQWVVMHGMLASSEIYDVAGVDSLIQIFHAAQKEDPAAALLISDAEALLLPGDSRVDEVIEFTTWLKSEGCKVGGIVLGASLARPYMAPQTIEKRLDRIASSGVGVPVFIAGLELETDKEATQEAMLRDLLSLFYSHQAVAGVSLASPWEAAAVNQRSALYRADMTPRKAGKMIENLLSSEWVTKAKGVTDDQGHFAVRAFHGGYRISAQVKGKTVKADAAVTSAKHQVALKAD